MKIFKKVLLLTMALLMCVSVVACGSTEDQFGLTDEERKNRTEIQVMNFGGGLGGEWLIQSMEDFMELTKDEVYETGKKGVVFDLESSTNTQSSSMQSSGIDIYFDVPSSTIQSYIGGNKLLDIDDIMDDVIETIDGQEITLNDKLDQSMMFDFKGSDGHVYALPNYEFFGGLTYDRTTFIKDNLYLADPTESAKVAYTCSITGETVNFVANRNAKKSVGGDGKSGTEDDGLPTTLNELIALCQYMKEVKQITPFTVAGGHIDYYSYFMTGLWACLAGEEEMKANYSFDGKITVVDFDNYSGDAVYTNENLWSGFSAIKKPHTREITLDGDLSKGYYTTQTLARYYIVAFTELAQTKGWFSRDAYSGTASHTIAQENFVFSGQDGGEKVGMLIEGSYWFNESRAAGHFEEYKETSIDGNERDVAWMSLPTSFNVPVTGESDARKQVLVDQGGSYAFINAKIAGNEGLVRACKDFMKFMFMQEQLKTFADNAGCYKSCVKAEYQPKVEELTNLLEAQRTILKIRDANVVVYQRADNELAQSRHIGCNAAIMKPKMGSTTYTCYQTAAKASKTTREMFESNMINSAAWSKK